MTRNTTKNERASHKKQQQSTFLSIYRSRLFLSLLLILIISLVGTIGYHIIEKWPFLDALYMTIITLTTVGFGETHELSPMGRVFTIVLIISSMGAAGYAISTIASFLIEGQLNDFIQGHRMQKHIANLNQHVILCGGGRTGKHLVGEFYKTHTPFVVIEKDEAILHNLQHIGDILYIHGDATDDDTLVEAGIERAKGLVAALGDDKDNVFIVLSARALNPHLRIIARLNEEENEEKLRKAGADEIVSPNSIGGLRMASLIIRPRVVAFLDEMMRVTGQTLRFEEIPIQTIPQLVHKTLAQADIGRLTGLLVVAIKPKVGGYVFNPRGSTRLNPGDVLIVLGTRQQITELDNVLAGHDSGSNLANVFQKSKEQ
jgi:voltage-gated potassium channel